VTGANPASSRPIVEKRPIIGDRDEALRLIALGHEASKINEFFIAEQCFRKAVALGQDLPMAYNNLGWVRQKQGDPEQAFHCYQRALELNPSFALVQVNLILLLTELNRFEETRPLLRVLLARQPEQRQLLDRCITTALCAGELAAAAAFAEEYAMLARASRWYAGEYPGPIPVTIVPDPVLTCAKLHHDREQLRYLRQHGLLPTELFEIIGVYGNMLATMISNGADDEVELAEADGKLVDDVYGRIIHLRHTPRVRRALSEVWDAVSIENDYYRDGYVIVDDFLSDEALLNLRLFCIESTVWFTNRYAHGRLGAFFRDGFNCPLLVQVAEEVSAAFPRVIGDTHRLLQMWGFKYNYVQPETQAHADFAAVNVNIWLTPDEANLDQKSGGMIIYELKAPKEWDFDSYNKRGGKIESLLKETGAHSNTVPYRSNRAIIFNSDLFHATAPIRFREGYVNRRVNVTMLYGTREAAAVSSGRASRAASY
jgi:tetratricopeptide (TPR) repeat protein